MKKRPTIEELEAIINREEPTNVKVNEDGSVTKVDNESEGLCDTTQTERFYKAACRCETYEGNLGPCRTFKMGGGGRCAYCDHEPNCHSRALKQEERGRILDLKNWLGSDRLCHQKNIVLDPRLRGPDAQLYMIEIRILRQALQLSVDQWGKPRRRGPMERFLRWAGFRE